MGNDMPRNQTDNDAKLHERKARTDLGRRGVDGEVIGRYEALRLPLLSRRLD
jgi:hypothetical protein